MEQKKLLLVFVSVGVFLVIVLGAGLLVFKPRPKPVAVAAKDVATSVPATADPSEWVKNPQAVPGLQPAAPGASTRGDVIIIYGERPEGNSATGRTAAVSPDGRLTVDVAVPQTQTQAAPTVPASPAQTYTEAPRSMDPKAAPVPKQQKPIAAKPATSEKKPAPPIKRGDEFWIQTGSFAAKARADAAKEKLSSKGIASLIETKEISGKTYFRVRVGPYSSKDEADYWLALVNTIDGFSDSYITEIKAKR